MSRFQETLTRFMRNNPGKKSGMTFIELVIVLSMVGVISLAIYSNFSNGLKAWQRVKTPLVQEDLNIFMDKFRVDLRNSFKFKGIVFSGTSEALQFPTLVSSPGLRIRTVGLVSYDYDRDRKKMSRGQNDYPGIHSGHGPVITQSLNGVIALKFQYYSFNEQEKKFSWQSEWNGEDKLPLAVRCEFDLENTSGRASFSQTISIPAGGG